METVRVRIAVAVDPDGNWCAMGWKDGDDTEWMSCALDDVAEGEAQYFVEATLSLPEAVTVEADKIESVTI